MTILIKASQNTGVTLTADGSVKVYPGVAVSNPTGAGVAAISTTVYTFAPINDPASPPGYGTVAMGINAGQVVGFYHDTTGITHGFVDTNGSFTVIDYPIIPDRNGTTIAYGINNAGQIVGGSSGYGSFVDTNGSFAAINDPAALYGTNAKGINDAGQVVGWSSDATGLHGFVDTNGSFTAIDMPGASSTMAYGINDAGQVVGEYTDSTGFHGFVETNGNFVTINDPLATGDTEVTGINDLGQIVGYYYGYGPSGVLGTHGFVDTDGSFTTIDAPNAVGSTMAYGINILGQIVGYTDAINGVVSPRRVS